MKLGPGIGYIVLCAILSLYAPMEPAWPLTFTAQTKDVRIDADWLITGRYTYEIRIMESDDIRQIRSLLHQLAERADQFKMLYTEVRMPGGRRLSWDTDATDALPAETPVFLAFEISNAFPGFSGLFADYMHIDQPMPLKNAAYRISFPEKTAFICHVVENHEIHQNRSDANFFSWSGDNISRLDIMISTASSWEQITERYQTLFQKKLGNGLFVIDLPETIRNANKNGSSTDKVHAVLNFMKTGIDYRGRMHSDNGFFPDEPSTVLHRGWGDCKDIALLGTAILQTMGIEAFVTLAGKPRIHGVGDTIPDPFIFDHALIGVSDSDRISYYDYPGLSKTAHPENQKIYLHLKVSANAGQ